MPQYTVPNPIKSLLAFLYPEQDQQALQDRVRALLQTPDPTRKQVIRQLGPEDNLLICYADQLYQEGEAPLATLKHFLDQYARPGITGVHLLPFFPYTSDDGFSVTDYLAVNPEAGTWEDIARLAADYELMFDGVINHISAQSDWVKKYLADDPAYANFFIDADPEQDYSMVTRPRALPLLSPVKDHAGRIRHLWTTFSADQVDLNYENPEVLFRVLEVLLTYVRKGATFLRLDAIGFMWKEAGTTCMHLPQTHAIIQLIRAMMDEVAPQVRLITETNVPHAENISYFGDGHNEAHLVYNFSLPPLIAYSLLAGDAEVLSTWAKALRLPSDATCFFNFTASHDGVGVRPVEGILTDTQRDLLARACLDHGGRISYRNRPDGSQSPYELNCNYLDLLTSPEAPITVRAQRFLLSQAMMLAFPGLPGIYLHSLAGSENCQSCLKARGHNRSINREKMPLARLETELATSPLRKTVFEGYSHLLETRASIPAFAPTAPFGILELDKRIFALERTGPRGEVVLALHNVSSESVMVSLPRGGMDLLSGEPCEAGPATLAPWQAKWIA